MNILQTVSNALAIFQQGKALNSSTFLTNTEAVTAIIYAVISAVVTMLNAFGVEVIVGGEDLHTIANGWSTTLSIVYAAYRLSTNPAAGVKVQK